MERNEDIVLQVQKLTNEKTCLEKDIQILNERLSSSHSDCIAKDNIVKKQVKIAEEAILGDLLSNSILNIFSCPFCITHFIVLSWISGL